MTLLKRWQLENSLSTSEAAQLLGLSYSRYIDLYNERQRNYKGDPLLAPTTRPSLLMRYAMAAISAGVRPIDGGPGELMDRLALAAASRGLAPYGNT